MDILTALGLSIPAGLNAYIPLLAVAVAQRFDWLQLRTPFDILGSWWMIAIIAVLLAWEIIADKIPAVDSVNDVVQSVIRTGAGGIVAVSAAGTGSGVPAWLLVLMGVLFAGGVNAAKVTSRPMVNVSTAGVGAPVVSTAEDAGAVVMSAAAIAVPVLVIFLIGVIIFALWYFWRRDRIRRRECELRDRYDSTRYRDPDAGPDPYGRGGPGPPATY